MKGVCFNVKRYHYCIFTDYFKAKNTSFPLKEQFVSYKKTLCFL